MEPEKRRQIASKGGVAAHRAGTGHRFTKEEAQAAGRKGGTAPRAHVSRGRAPKEDQLPLTSETP